MANTLTSLMPDLYSAVDMVLREVTGFIASCTLDAGAARAALNQTVRVPITPAAAAENTTPGATPPDTGDQTIGNTTITITKSRTVPFRWTGEEQRGMNSGPGYANLRRDQIAQAIRTLVNELEVDLGLAGIVAASRAYGTAGTAPFGTTIADLANVGKILTDNGCPPEDRQLVINTAAGLNLRSLANLYKVNEGGDDSLLRQGMLTSLYGFAIRESAGVATHTKGTGASYLHDEASQPVGSTALHVDTGTGTILAGDVVTWTADTNKYVVKTGFAGDGDGDIVLGAPGLRAALADDVAMTIGNSYAGNLAFHRSALVAAVRPPALPEEGDAASDRTLITDPRTGITFEFCMYPQYRRVRYDVSLAWGTAGIKPEATAILLG